MNEKQTVLDWGFGLKWIWGCALGTAVPQNSPTSFFLLVLFLTHDASGKT